MHALLQLFIHAFALSVRACRVELLPGRPSLAPVANFLGDAAVSCLERVMDASGWDGQCVCKADLGDVADADVQEFHLKLVSGGCDGRWWWWWWWWWRWR